MTKRCPYCGGTNLGIVQSLLKGGAEEAKRLGVQIPEIQNCLDCCATLRPDAFIVGTAAYREAAARVARG